MPYGFGRVLAERLPSRQRAFDRSTTASAAKLAVASIFLNDRWHIFGFRVGDKRGRAALQKKITSGNSSRVLRMMSTTTLPARNRSAGNDKTTHRPDIELPWLQTTAASAGENAHFRCFWRDVDRPDFRCWRCGDGCRRLRRIKTS